MKTHAILLGLLLLTSYTLSAKEKYALIVGINDYEHPQIQDLKYSEADARYLRDILIRYARYQPNHIRILLGREATYSNIKDGIYWLGESTKKEDDVFFYFSGHGTRVDDMDGNEQDGLDEAFCPYETDLDKTASVILDDEIGYWFRRVRSSQVIVILDCCHSGGAAGRSLEYEGEKGVVMRTGTGSRGLLDPDQDPYSRDLTVDNKFIITASDADEQSYENPGLGHGVFTYYIGEAIRGNADADNDKKISTREMFEYTKEKTIEFARSINKKQTPIKFGSLEDAIIVEISRQLCSLRLYDSDLKRIWLGIGGDLVQPDDLFILKKSMQGARDLEIADIKIFKIEITTVHESYSEGIIIEEYYRNISIDPSNYGEYYAERLAFGTMHIITEPWAMVYLDGDELGPSPIIVNNVPEGDHEIEFRIRILGYPDRVMKRIFVPGDSITRIVEAIPRRQE